MSTNKDIKPLSQQENILWNSAGSLVNLIAQWGISILIVQLSSGFDAAGLYSLAVTVYNIFAPIGQYRMYTYQISDVNRENTTGEYFSFRIITGLGALLLCYGYALLTCPSHSFSTIACFGFYKFIELLIDVLHARCQRNGRLDYVGISLAAQGIASLSVFSVSFLLTQSIVLAILLMTIAIACVGLFFTLPRSLLFGEIHLGITRQKAFRLLLLALPFVISSITSSAALSLPRQELFRQYGDAMLGIYGSVAAPVAIIPTAASYVYYPLIGEFADLYDRRQFSSFLLLMLKVLVAMLALGFFFSIVLGFVGGPLLDFVFGNGAGDYAYLLQPLIINAIISAFAWFENDLLIALRNHLGPLLSGGLSLVSSLFSAPYFVQLFGSNGVSYTCIAAGLVAIITMTLFIVFQLRKMNTATV